MNDSQRNSLTEVSQARESLYKKGLSLVPKKLRCTEHSVPEMITKNTDPGKVDEGMVSEERLDCLEDRIVRPDCFNAFLIRRN